MNQRSITDTNQLQELTHLKQRGTYLTDRVGNYAELEPYLDLWRAVRCDNGVLEIVVIEHDDVSYDVPRIPKGTDGRALA